MSNESIKQIAMKLGVPDTVEHIQQRIHELNSQIAKKDAEIQHLREIVGQPIWVIGWWRFKSVMRDISGLTKYRQRKMKQANSKLL